MRHIDLNVFALSGFLFGLFLLHSTAYAQSDAYDLRGIKLGIPLVDFRKITYPDLDRFKNARSICTGDAEAERARGGYKLQQYSYEKQLKIIKCSWFSPEVVGSNFGSVVYEVGGIPAGVIYKFVAEPSEAKPLLFEIEATINNDHFDYLVDAYKEKYGSPVKNKIESVQNKAGAHFENQILTWKSASSTLEIEQRYENVTLMRVRYTHDRLSFFVNSMASKILGKPSDKL